MTVSMGLMMQDDDVSNCINSQKEIITATVDASFRVSKSMLILTLMLLIAS